MHFLSTPLCRGPSSARTYPHACREHSGPHVASYQCSTEGKRAVKQSGIDTRHGDSMLTNVASRNAQTISTRQEAGSSNVGNSMFALSILPRRAAWACNGNDRFFERLEMLN
jgi:hypothetical protein